MNLLSYLPVDKSSFYLPQYNAIVNGEEYTPDFATGEPTPPKGWWKKALDRRRGRSRPRDTISLDEFVKNVKSK